MIPASNTILGKLGEKRRVINALLIRDLMLRFGHGNIGLCGLWASR